MKRGNRDAAGPSVVRRRVYTEVHRHERDGPCCRRDQSKVYGFFLSSKVVPGTMWLLLIERDDPMRVPEIETTDAADARDLPLPNRTVPKASPRKPAFVPDGSMLRLALANQLAVEE